jgi:hypothetical protein
VIAPLPDQYLEKRPAAIGANSRHCCEAVPVKIAAETASFRLVEAAFKAKMLIWFDFLLAPCGSLDLPQLMANPPPVT